jgi:hypothetical protein
LPVTLSQTTLSFGFPGFTRTQAGWRLDGALTSAAYGSGTSSRRPAAAVWPEWQPVPTVQVRRRTGTTCFWNEMRAVP